MTDTLPKLSLETTDRQRRYVERQKKNGSGMGLVFADAFIRGMRDIGYKSPAWAIAEMIDNSIQASANAIDIRFLVPDNKVRVTPDAIAVIDNGVGMIPEMISFAVRWGGTDRENDRRGFGRYGYGLPSSAVSIACKYSVYSKVVGGDWNVVDVDLGELAAAAHDLGETEKLLEPRKEPLPDWLFEGRGKIDVGNLKSGTIVVLEDLDRVRRHPGWSTMQSLPTKLLQHFGVIYRHWIPRIQIVVNGVTTEVIDPLFLMEHGRYFSETSVYAKKVPARTFEFESEGGSKGKIQIRASILPPNFQLVNPEEYRIKGKNGKLSQRHDVMKSFNGLLICREGRQIDVVSPDWTKFQNYDMNIKIEIDFSPELDEYFGITTSKQQIVIDEKMLERLKQDGKECGDLINLVKDMRAAFDMMQDELAAVKEKTSAPDEPLPSERAMEASEKYKTRKIQPLSVHKAGEAEKNLQEEAVIISKAVGKPKTEVLRDLAEATEKKKWAIEFKAIDEGPFYIPRRLGEQKRLIINTAHPFYDKLFQAMGARRSSLEVLLFVLAEAEIEAEGDREVFYKAERQNWSERLRHALDELVEDQALIDRTSMDDEKDALASAVR